ncbi:helix-turn-helix domain-containing protein [Agrobacterium rubi]|uniref:Transcriptional regulator n=1 Tax=Agrobacterium rubi TaxID=28099 RepID=A0AAE7R2V8_9HYPH|nr:transcriptional regulator [Agrobacterium rubi]NTE86592.1 transcriptional regulator [Agrobacterium rubi]NTF02524.1 transcriptional regulator [Agrobacterium rubi]NTF36769.1 transcriptional regulator [Agrobacterium rubi]OCJ55869.1 transcriptional regulator [Agrobacterium rubi]QTF99217.1 transcriptional regulator [Agrobacterium rubi]
MTQEQLRSAPRIPQVNVIRRALRLTQEEFSARYQIPLGTLRDWEQSRSEPDQHARAYLKVIAVDPAGTAAALKKSAV